MRKLIKLKVTVIKYITFHNLCGYHLQPLFHSKHSRLPGILFDGTWSLLLVALLASTASLLCCFCCWYPLFLLLLLFAAFPVAVIYIFLPWSVAPLAVVAIIHRCCGCCFCVTLASACSLKLKLQMLSLFPKYIFFPCIDFDMALTKYSQPVKIPQIFHRN